MSRGLPDRGAVLREVLILWLVTLVVVRVWISVVDAGLHEVFKAVVPILFMYVPVLACELRGVDSYSYPLYLPRFRDTDAWLEAFKLNAVVIAILTLPFILVYHYWTTLALGGHWMAGDWPPSMLMLIGYHLFFVAIPEEFFYRGYIQTRLDEAFRPRWRIFGANLGWGWLITCVVFALGHSVVQYQWWHVLIIFPSLVFGWMRARTGGILAGALFHAACNVAVSTLDHVYGIITP